MLLSARCHWSWSHPARVFALGGIVVWLGNIFSGIASAAEPPPELAAAARDYRIEIYGSFRTNRAEYDVRRKQGEALLAEWQSRGALPEEAAALVRWFDEARRASARQQPLPSAPNWNGSVEESIPVPARSPSMTTRPAGPLPLLRALPVKRVRVGRQVNVTAISSDIVRPRESMESFALLTALSDHSSLGLILEFPYSASERIGNERIGVETDLPKSDTLARANISAGPIHSPEPKTVVLGNEPATNTNSTTEAAELNTAELRARIRGYDKAWRALQVDLYSEEELTLERGDALVMIFKDLGQARRDLLLYQAIAPAELREEIRGLAALDELQAQLRKLIDGARANVAADQALTPQQRAAYDRAWVKLLDMK